ncbi:MAG: PilZ domain-containing protein [Acidobacteriia bacterium]|nr:PilZ domain-containing protein [Terriglobia bacterium]
MVKLRFWGVRGSTPTVDKATWRYGGNTPCLELTTPGGTRLILDCGTGLRMLGRHLESAPESRGVESYVFVTHYHWDHIQGIPFFAPLYSEQNRFHFYSFRSEYLGRDSLKRVFEAQMAHPYFPVDISAMSAPREFIEVSGGDQFDVPGARVTARWLHHPQGCLGFRFETPAGTVAYATDNEPGNPKLDQSLRELAAGADIFINDAQFTPEQLATTRKGWGHSSWLAGAKTAEEAGVKNLVLFHHDPDSTDKMMDSILREARGKFAHVWAAAEGMVMTLGQGNLDVVIPPVREWLRRETHFRARVSGFTDAGQAFEEETVIRDMSLHGALIYLDHSPKLQSELQVQLDNPGIEEGSNSPLRLRGYVVRIDPEVEKDRTAVGIVFTE